MDAGSSFKSALIVMSLKAETVVEPKPSSLANNALFIQVTSFSMTNSVRVSLTQNSLVPSAE